MRNKEGKKNKKKKEVEIKGKKRIKKEKSGDKKMKNALKRSKSSTVCFSRKRPRVLSCRELWKKIFILF